MGTASYVLAGCESGELLSWSSACHGAGRSMSRHAATKRWQGRAVVDDVLRHPQGGVTAELIDARPLLPDVPALGSGPDIQLWPHRHGTDAMYLALLRRTS